ncbi:MAG TPA: type IX secretion system membrane protein PorP/SprF [Flavobacteriales bacterium]|nr:type IX secretion system membrane protein PorP/SprF [Flavobacteriales bacterium]HIA13042.1 type IX secretion system membrane protein PorP/SprF [Flavobacteriales bacterium]
MSSFAKTYCSMVLLLFGGLTASFGQDPQFSQFYAAPIYLNPAFTGNTTQVRAAAIYRKQWPRITKAFNSFGFFYDMNIQKIKSGIGFVVLTDKSGASALKFTNIGLSYAYKTGISRKVSISAGARASYTIRGINKSELRFYDQYVRDDPNSTIEDLPTNQITYFDLAAGMIVFSRSFWVGLSFDHLTQPYQSFIKIATVLPIKYSFHGGYKIPFEKTIKGDVTKSLTIAMNYKGQQDWDQLDLGLYLDYQGFLLGLWYRGIPVLKAYQAGYSNNDAIIFLVGYKLADYISIGYSFDLTISKLSMASGGSHEISLIYEWAQPKYKRDNMKKDFMMPCMKF